MSHFFEMMSAGFSDGNGAPSGYTVTHTYTENGAAATVYSGTDSTETARSTFTNWLKSQGWSESEQEEMALISAFMGGNSGQMFTMGEKMLILTVMFADGVVSVTTTIY